MYVITDNQVFLKTKGGHKIVNSLREAGHYKMNKAKNIIKAMPQDLKKYDWRVKFATVNNKEIVEISKDKVFNYDLDYEISRMEKFSKDLQEQELSLREKLQELELKIVDLEHYLEFYNLDMYSSWKYYKLFQSVMRERRCIKNDIAKIHYILSSNMQNAAMNNISKASNRLNNRQYTPRILIDLFNEDKVEEDNNNLSSWGSKIIMSENDKTDLNNEEKKILESL